MSGIRTGRVSKHRRGHRMKTRPVLRMMAIMQDRKSEEVPKEFLETGRTGRRNAMPDILHPQGAECTTADLPSRLQQLATTDTDNPQPCSSKAELEINKEDDSTAKKIAVELRFSVKSPTWTLRDVPKAKAISIR